MFQIPINYDQLPKIDFPKPTQESITNIQSNKKSIQIGVYNFDAYRDPKKLPPEIKPEIKDKKIKKPVETVKPESKFSKLISYFRRGKKIESKEEKELDLPKIQSIDVFNNGIDGKIIGGTVEEKRNTLENFVETLNNDLAETQINFGFTVEGNSYTINFASRSNQTNNNIDIEHSNQPIVVDQNTRLKIEKLTDQIQAGI